MIKKIIKKSPVAVVIFFLSFIIACTFSTEENHVPYAIDTSAYYRIVSVKNQKCFDIENGSDKDGARIILREAQSSETQQFKLRLLDNGAYNIICKKNNKYFDVPKGSSEDGLNIVQWFDNRGGANQMFNFIPFAKDSYYIISRVNDKYLSGIKNPDDSLYFICQMPINKEYFQVYKLEIVK